MWWVLAVILFVIAAVHIVLPKFYHSFEFERLIRKVPGPPTAFFIGTKGVASTSNEGFLSMLVQVTNDYRPLVRLDVLGSYSIIITDVKDIETIMNSKLYIKKSLDYEILLPWLGQGLVTSAGERWFSHRRLLTPVFHFGILEPYIDVFRKNSQILVKKFKDSNKNPVPILPAVSLCTLDIVCETAMGKIVNAQQGGAKDYVQAVLEMSKLFQIRQLSPWLYRECMFKLFPTGQRTKEVLKILHGFTNKVINEKREEFRRNRDNLRADQNDDSGVKGKRSFLDLLIEISEVEGKLTHEQIREETDTFMFEGHDTTATAISWVLFELALNPDIQEAVFQELDRIFEGSDRDVTNADLTEMKYLERVIKETLRLYPSVPIIGRHLEKNVTLSGYEIPAGANVGIFIYYIHRNPEIYPQPDKFNPDRFLPDRIASRHPYSYIPFSAGPRNCIGQKFAMMEEKVVLSEILRKFKISSLTKREDLLLMAELILRPKDNVLLTFTPRGNLL